MLVIFNSELNRRSLWKSFINRIYSKDLSQSGTSSLELGETSVTAYRGDRGKTAYDHSQVAHAPIPKVKTYQSLSSSSNAIAFNTNNGVNMKTTLTENTTITLSNLVDGDEGNIVITQAAGNYTVAISPTPYVIDDGAGAVVITDGAGSVTILSYTYDGSRLFITYGANYTNS